MIDEKVEKRARELMREMSGKEDGHHAPTAEDIADLADYIGAADNITEWTALVIALNWKIWELYERDEEKAREYNKLWEKYDADTFTKWSGDALTYYLRNTD